MILFGMLHATLVHHYIVS